MRRFSFGLIAIVVLSFGSVRLAGAQTQTTGCLPAPQGAVSVVCFGNAPCPYGYIDPVGSWYRVNFAAPGQNPLVPQSASKWLCQLQTAVQQNSGISTANGAITGPAASGTGAAIPSSLTFSVAGSPTGSSASTSTTVASAPAAAVAPPAPSTSVLVSSTPTLGSFLTTAQGMTLYVRALDAGGVSTCTGSCAIIWTPFAPPSSSLTLPATATKALAVITRDDGTQQVTYDGNPLYTYTGDFNPGDTNGAGLADIWLVAAP